MEWNSKWGDQVEYLQNLASEGKAVPAALVNRPLLSSYLKDIINGFMFLSGRRPLGGMGGMGQIPLQEIIAYVDQVEMIDDPEDREDFIKYINHLDQLYLKDAYEKLKAKPKAPSTNTPRGARR